MRIEYVKAKVDFEKDDNNLKDYLDNAFYCLKDMESYPTYMHDVQKVKVNPINEDQSYVEWETKVDDACFNWKQITTYEPEIRRITFEMVEGDFEMLKGKWYVDKEPSKNRTYNLNLDMEYSIGLPVIEEILGPILNEKMLANSLSMLTSIKNRIGEYNA